MEADPLTTFSSEVPGLAEAAAAFAQRPTTYVVLDSNVLTADWLLRGLAFRVLRYLAENHLVCIGIPEVVLAEVRANHARTFEVAQRDLRRTVRDHGRLGIPLAVPDVAGTEDYPSQLDYALELLDASVIPWPSVTHEQLVARSVKHQPPFNAQGGGYRDALVWYSALSFATAESPAVLVSQDRAFSNKQGAIHHELAAEAAASGVQISLVTNLSGWVTKQVPWLRDQSLTEMAAIARDERLERFLMQSDYLYNLELDSSALTIATSSGEVEVQDIGFFEDFRRTTSMQLPNAGTLVEYQLNLALSVEAEVSVQEAEQRGWSHAEPDLFGRVRVEIDLELSVYLTALFDLYDDDFSVDLTRIVRRDPFEGPTASIPTRGQMPIPGVDESTD